MSRILVGVTGSVSAYKAVDFVNGLVKTGNDVKVIMTQSATQFINPISFFNAKVYTDDMEWKQQDDLGILHIDLAKWAEAIAIYPATANTIAKLNYGFADNLLTTTWMASNCCKYIFPAMNTEMLHDKTNRSNMDALNMRRDTEVMETESGLLACGDKGEGKIMRPRNAVIVVNQKMHNPPSNKTILVTSGGTKAPLDGVRVVTNISSGALGAVTIDHILTLTGYNVIHIAPKMSIQPQTSKLFPHRYRFVRADTVEQVYEAMKDNVPKADAVIHSMAISDFTFESLENEKLKSNDPKAFIKAMSKSVKKSPKIINKIKEWNPDTILVGFKFEVGATEKVLEGLAKKQMEKAGSDLVLVNDKQKMVEEGEHVAKLYLPDNKGFVGCRGKQQIAMVMVKELKHQFVARAIEKNRK